MWYSLNLIKLVEKGYNAINQIVGYLISNDPAYISSYDGARKMIQKVTRDEIIEELVKSYLKKFKSNFLNIKKSSMVISIIISILCAFLTGHVLATPAVSIFISVILVIYYNEFKMEE